MTKTTKRTLRWTLAVVGLLVAAMLPTGDAGAQEETLLPDDVADFLPPGELLRPETTLAALMGLEVDRQVEERILIADLRRLAAWRARRDQGVERLRTLYNDLDTAFNVDDEGKDDTGVEDLERRLLDLESRLFGAGGEGRQIRHRIRERRLRLRVLSAKVDAIISLLPSDNETLTGVWDVVVSPVNEHGVFTLFQTGTLLAGEYVLGGGWHGSLEGTVVDGQVFLERIDAEKGRFASLSGRLDAAGRSIRGIWQERDLTANRPVEGQWTAHRRPRGRRSAP